MSIFYKDNFLTAIYKDDNPIFKVTYNNRDFFLGDVILIDSLNLDSGLSEPDKDPNKREKKEDSERIKLKVKLPKNCDHIEFTYNLLNSDAYFGALKFYIKNGSEEYEVWYKSGMNPVPQGNQIATLDKKYVEHATDGDYITFVASAQTGSDTYGAVLRVAITDVKAIIN